MVQHIDGLSTTNSILVFDWEGTKIKMINTRLTSVCLGNVQHPQKLFEGYLRYMAFQEGYHNPPKVPNINTYDVIIENIEQSKKLLSMDKLKQNIISYGIDPNVSKPQLHKCNSHARLSSKKIDQDVKSSYIVKPKGALRIASKCGFLMKISIYIIFLYQCIELR